MVSLHLQVLAWTGPVFTSFLSAFGEFPPCLETPRGDRGRDAKQGCHLSVFSLLPGDRNGLPEVHENLQPFSLQREGLCSH